MVLFWHRRDLRIHDNAGLYKALKRGDKVKPIFIFDKEILDDLPKDDQRVLFIHQEITKLKKAYQDLGSDLTIYYGDPIEVFKRIIEKEIPQTTHVFTNRDYEPYALNRDKAIFEYLKSRKIEFIGAKDHVIFEKEEITKDDGKPYKVFTPYMRRWKEKVNDFYLKSYPTKKYTNNLSSFNKTSAMITLADMGFSNEQKMDFPSVNIDEKIIKDYEKTRDIPALKGTTRMSLHLRFGTVSIRELARIGGKNEKYLNELIWRDFYQMIIYYFPEIVNKALKPKYDDIPWENDEKKFKKWSEGKTGYPIVDAGMRELNKTGFMHNRVRMIVASFLTKHLLIDWRWGEAYFAKKLLDFELASNAGGWQWAASSGVDAQPYFRVFNPYTQQEKFDKDEKYIKKWIPEYKTSDYPEPIVEHKFARERAINTFKETLK